MLNQLHGMRSKQRILDSLANGLQFRGTVHIKNGLVHDIAYILTCLLSIVLVFHHTLQVGG
jgi:hypothetical protein